MTEDSRASELVVETDPVLLAIDGNPRDVGEATEALETSPAQDSRDQEDGIHTSILEMKKMVQESSSGTDSTSLISRLDQVQDRLIDNLEALNQRIENYIELLANQRKSA